MKIFDFISRECFIPYNLASFSGYPLLLLYCNVGEIEEKMEERRRPRDEARLSKSNFADFLKVSTHKI